MKHSLEKSYEILDRTPSVLKALMLGLHTDWVMSNEGPDTFSPYEVVGHLIHGEKTDWVVRAKSILEHGTERVFVPWNRFAQFEESKGKPLPQLLEEFETMRGENMRWVKLLNLTEADLDKKGIHPKLGEVTLRNVFATWVAHDLTHIAQVTRVMAKQYKEEMGPWPEFFRILSF